MNKVSVVVRVFFEDPFWIGLVEVLEDQQWMTARIVYGSQPGNAEVLEILRKNYDHLMFSPTLEQKQHHKPMGFKRMQRQAQQEMKAIGIATKSQQALKLLQEETRGLRKARQKEHKQLKKQMQYEQRKQKSKKRHRGK